METFIPATSPLFRYTPCRDCDPSLGFSSAPAANDQASSSGRRTTAPDTSISLNFTGTSISFHLGDVSPSITTSISIDGEDPPSTSNVTATSVSNLKFGSYSFQLDIHQPSDQSEDITFHGITGGLGSLWTAQSSNETIDDTAWREDKVILTPAWNMLEQSASNWINTTQYDSELQMSNNDFNGSISWTEQVNASTTIRFNGTSVWTFGISGGEAGIYEVLLDGLSEGLFDASGGPRVYQSLLYHTSGLNNAEHNLTLRNVEQGKRLSFDFVNATSGLLPVTNEPLAAPVPIPPIPPTVSPDQAASASSSVLNAGTIAAIAVCSSLATITALVLAIWLLKRTRNRSNEKEKEPSIKPLTTFWRWSGPGPADPSDPLEKDRPFLPLPSPPVSSGLSGAPFARWPSPPMTDRTAISSPKPSQTSFLRLSKSPKRTKATLPSLKSTFTIDSGLMLPPSAATLDQQQHHQHQQQGSISSFHTQSKSGSRLPTPLFEQSKYVERPCPEHPPTDFSASPTPPFFHALTAAVNGKTSSPLSELRDSYFPEMKPKALKKKGARGESNGSISIKTAVTGSEDRPQTPGWILDGYGRNGGQGIDNGGTGVSKAFVELSPRAESARRKPFGGRSGWAAFIAEEEPSKEV
ncbi:hypothetical protein BD324DRAFT_647961 [Kockovaella imperatae]|uniref:Uncharacterized protein n=1 Tax=Kockovaella imperatae TaxID=4999 RepID=A0A1Y1UU39_9TREE|nr:hypothetical protein BD324DRAFT_647961 [Kockovaella imperatae]ORX41064.1 hypothetical protein BD324DRAFT_647961 [Kockovaella imperatae]